MIKHLEIRRFKSIREAVIDCTRVNVFIGKPNVGKSNFLEVFSLFNNVGIGLKSIRLKQLSNLFFNNAYNEGVEIIIDQKNLTIKTQDEACSAISMDLIGFATFNKDLPGLVHTPIGYSYDADNRVIADSTNHNEFKILKRIKRYVYNLSNDGFDRRNVQQLVAPYGENIYSLLTTRADFAKEIGAYFKEYNLKLRLNTITKAIEIQKEIDDFSITILDYSMIADSLKRLIFHILAIKTNIDSVLAFEEPEAHTYAPYTIQIADMISGDENGNQYFLATHSNYFLNALLKNLGSDELSIFFVTYRDDATHITKATEEQMYEMQKLGVDPFLNMSVI